MNLPSLDELGLNEPVKAKENKKSSESSTAKEKKSSAEKKPKETKQDNKKEESLYKENGKRRIPKSQYDENGSPILSIPDLDDVNLKKELNKFF